MNLNVSPSALMTEEMLLTNVSFEKNYVNIFDKKVVSCDFGAPRLLSLVAQNDTDVDSVMELLQERVDVWVNYESTVSEEIEVSCLHALRDDESAVSIAVLAQMLKPSFVINDLGLLKSDKALVVDLIKYGSFEQYEFLLGNPAVAEFHGVKTELNLRPVRELLRFFDLDFGDDEESSLERLYKLTSLKSSSSFLSGNFGLNLLGKAENLALTELVKSVTNLAELVRQFKKLEGEFIKSDSEGMGIDLFSIKSPIVKRIQRVIAQTVMSFVVNDAIDGDAELLIQFIVVAVLSGCFKYHPSEIGTLMSYAPVDGKFTAPHFVIFDGVDFATDESKAWNGANFATSLFLSLAWKSINPEIDQKHIWTRNYISVAEEMSMTLPSAVLSSKLTVNKDELPDFSALNSMTIAELLWNIKHRNLVAA
ncbi:hypothetical protein [Vibrio sp. D431a]|uniref:hypothetical protein n=1 Tax=Vibrio sp. D431a TaxID=2837388 RepID=UPI0025575B8D|nr:hypothetical protein [Vibrio sp. D431a]MDK9789986.1 hypothetical protein [Vibrio sp. D431a]